jgi:hypothetical protein
MKNIIGLILVIITAAIFIPLAFSERGYWAIGGEWPLIILSFFISRWIYKKLFGGRYAE